MFGASGGVVAIHSAVNTGGTMNMARMVKATIFNATNQAGGTLAADGNAVIKMVANEAGGTLRFSGSAAIMGATNAGTMSITGLLSGFLANVDNVAGGVMTVQVPPGMGVK